MRGPGSPIDRPPGRLARLDAKDTLIAASRTRRIRLAAHPWTEHAFAVPSSTVPALEFRWATDEGPHPPRRETPDPPLQSSLGDEAFRALILSPNPVVKPNAKWTRIQRCLSQSQGLLGRS